MRGGSVLVLVYSAEIRSDPYNLSGSIYFHDGVIPVGMGSSVDIATGHKYSVTVLSTIALTWSRVFFDPFKLAVIGEVGDQFFICYCNIACFINSDVGIKAATCYFSDVFDCPLYI